MDLAIAFGVRLVLVALFLPFSALDKVLNFQGAVAQAGQVARWRPLAIALIVVGFCVEVGMSAAILTGIADRLAAAVLAAYCVATAVLWKQFWAKGAGRDLFWDFWKNVAVAGGFLLITFGASARSVDEFISAPLSSTHPYQPASQVP